MQKPKIQYNVSISLHICLTARRREEDEKTKEEIVWLRQWWRGKIFCRVHFIGAVFAITTIARNIISNFQVTGDDSRQVEKDDVAKDVSHDINITQLIMIEVLQILSTNVLIII